MLTAQPKAGQAGKAGEAGEHTSRTGLAYRPALDGLRALAVVVVFAYHARLSWARAGFLGVDVFFVLSGYLITALLLLEHQREGRIDLVRFWCRRARRLLPALIVLLAAVAVAVPILAQEQAHRLRTDLVAALGYVSNWRLILENQSYFEATGRPPVLQHLWSLAVEEQFYLLWPIALIWLLRRKGRPVDPRRLVRPLVLVAIGSAVLMALLHRPYSDPSRVYYGTDTRAGTLLLGAALACATVRWQLIDRLHRGGRRALDILGTVGLVALAWAVTAVDEFDPKLYRGGFLAVAVASAAVVVAAARPGTRGLFATILGSRPLVWLGRRSYAVYLWFWPVLMLTRPHSDIPLSGAPLLALRIALTLTLAAVSYRFVERPAHRGALGRVWADVRRARRTRSPLHRPSAAWGLALAAAVVCVGSGVAVSRPPADDVNLNARAAAELAAILRAGATTTTTAPPTTVPPSTDAPTAIAPTTVAPDSTSVAPPALTVPPPLPVVQAKVSAIGDSVLLGAKPLLERQVEGIVVDAEVGRHFPEVAVAARALRDSGSLGEQVIVQIGNNGPISNAQFDEILEVFKGARKILVVNVKVDRSWEAHNNQVLAEGVSRWPNAVLIDWHGAASKTPDTFYDDGLHLTPGGMTLFAQLVLTALGA